MALGLARLQIRMFLKLMCAATSQAEFYNHAIRLVDVASGLVTTLAGSPSQTSGHADGVGAAASFYNPRGVAMDAAGTFVVVVRGGGWWVVCVGVHLQWC